MRGNERHIAEENTHTSVLRFRNGEKYNPSVPLISLHSSPSYVSSSRSPLKLTTLFTSLMFFEPRFTLKRPTLVSFDLK